MGRFFPMVRLPITITPHCAFQARHSIHHSALCSRESQRHQTPGHGQGDAHRGDPMHS